jgi:hypothetical protein
MPSFDRLAMQTQAAFTSGYVQLAFTTCRTSFTASKIRTYSGTAAGATPTLVKLGIYSEAANGDLTLLAATANTPTIYATANTKYEPALTTTVNLVAGNRYALAAIVVTTAALPTTPTSFGASAAQQELAIAPRRAGNRTGQSDLPATIPSGNINAFYAIYLVALP